MQTGDGGSGSRERTSDREHGEFNDRTDGHGHAGILWQVFHITISIFTSGKRGSLEKISARVYIFIIHMFNGILNIIASLTNFSQPLCLHTMMVIIFI